MSFTIYGLRLLGEREVRYVGRTRFELPHRLYGHMHKARRMRTETAFARWLADNDGRVEPFEIGTVATMVEARQLERETVEAAVKLGQRLFNQWLVPSAFRLPPRLHMAEAA